MTTNLGIGGKSQVPCGELADHPPQEEPSLLTKIGKRYTQDPWRVGRSDLHVVAVDAEVQSRVRLRKFEAFRWRVIERLGDRFQTEGEVEDRNPSPYGAEVRTVAAEINVSKEQVIPKRLRRDGSEINTRLPRRGARVQLIVQRQHGYKGKAVMTSPPGDTTTLRLLAAFPAMSTPI